MDKVFFETHKKGATLVTSEASTKHVSHKSNVATSLINLNYTINVYKSFTFPLQADLVKIVELNPTLSNIEVMDKSYTSVRRKRVVGFGGGIKARDLRGPALSKAELVSKLQKSEEEKEVLAEKLDVVVGEVAEIKRLMSTRSLSNIPHETRDDRVSYFCTIILYVIIHFSTLFICTNSYIWFMFFVGC